MACMYKWLWASTQKLREIIWIAHFHESTECDLRFLPSTLLSSLWAHVKPNNPKTKKRRSSAGVTWYQVCKPDSSLLSLGHAGSSSAYWYTGQAYFSQNCFSCSLWGYLLSDVADTFLSVPGPHPVLPEASVLRVGDLDTMDVGRYCVFFFPQDHKRVQDF